jgi:hypothetical protein
MTSETVEQPTGSRSDIRDAIVRCRDARGRAVEWTLARLGDDGEPVGAREQQAYYRVPWTLAVCGERDPASRVMAWIERSALSVDGDLLPTGDPGGDFTHRWSSYPLAIMAIGSWHLERDDTALAIMRSLRQFQDPESGGAFTERPAVRSTGRQDLFPTAQLGMAALTTGQTDMAIAAYNWITRLHALQPDLPRRLYTATDSDGLILRPDPSTEWEVITDFEKPRQAFYNPGIAAAFLARYYLQTGEAAARELARGYLSLSAGGTPAQFDYRESAQICKFGWGSALMLVADPAGPHLANVLKMADWFVDSQQADGRWHNSPFLVPDPTDADDLAVTMEFALHLTTIMGALAGMRP